MTRNSRRVRELNAGKLTRPKSQWAGTARARGRGANGMAPNAAMMEKLFSQFTAVQEKILGREYGTLAFKRSQGKRGG